MTVEIPLTRGLVALIDDEDLPLVAGHKWYARPATNNKGWYAVSSIDGRTTSMHRLIFGMPIGDRRKCDHRDGDGLNNRRENLRSANSVQNAGNSRVRSGIGFKGVFPSGNRFRVKIQAQHAGCYRTPEEAAVAYDFEARRRYGEFACLNFPAPGERSAITGLIVPSEAAA